MELFSIEIRHINVNGNGVITTYLYKAKNEDMAEKKAISAYEKHITKLYDDMDVDRILVNKIKMGLFSERSWKNC